MNNRARYIIAGALFLLLIVFVEISRPPEVVWTPSFSRSDDIPFGSSLVFESIEDLFPGEPVNMMLEPLFNYPMVDNVTGNYMFIDLQLQFDEYDVRILLDLARRGHSIFLASLDFGEALQDSLNFDIASDYSFYGDTATVSLLGSVESKTYRFPRGFFSDFFSKVDTANAVMLGKTSMGNYNMIRQPFGKGAFYLSLLPHAFTNYYLVDKENVGYIEHALSFLPVNQVVWDEYYKEINSAARESSFRFVLSNAPLRYAYYTALAGILLFVIFQSRRIQRIIPIIRPPENTTVQFTNTISRLYLQNGDHHLMAGKLISHFKEHLHLQYGINSDELNKNATERLHRRSGIPTKDAEQVFNMIKRVEGKTEISEKELQKLHKEIETIYQRSR